MTMNLDDVWAMVGDFGRFQKWSLVHWSMVGLFAGLHCISYVIISDTPPFRCFVPGCDNQSSPFNHVTFKTSGLQGDLERCRSASTTDFFLCGSDVLVPSTNGNETPCDRWIYDTSGQVITTVTKWDLVCDNESLAPLTQSVLMFGTMLGCIIFGYGADRFGRKPCIFVAISITSVASALSPLMPQFVVFLAFRLIVGAGIMGAYVASWSYVLEIIGAKQRLLVCTILNSTFACGEALLGLIGYFVHDWSKVIWIISAPSFLWLVILCWFCESPRWLITSKNFEKAKKAFQQIAKVNGKEIVISELKLDQLQVVEEGETLHHYSALDLFRTPKLRWLTINLTFNWFASTLSYYGISMALPPIGGNTAMSLIIVSVIEIPSYLFLFFFLDKFGRKGILVATLILGGIAGVCNAPVALIPDLQWLTFILVLLSKFCCAAAFGNLFLFSNELFPTCLRSNGVGVCSLMGHMAAILSPYVAQLKVFHPALPTIIFGCLSLVSGLAAISLPETAGKRLPDNVDDLESYPDARANCKRFWQMLFCCCRGESTA